MAGIKQYKCPNCKHEIMIARADFIKGIAMVSCNYCGKDAFACQRIEEDYIFIS
jgi:transcription elongation factor Elf1